VHESTDLDRAGSRTRHGITVTDPARTILDLARRTGDARLLEAIESARRQRLTSWAELAATLAKHARRGRPGIRRLRRVIARNVHREEVTDSTFELLVIALLLENGLPEPVLHHRILDDDGRLVAEVDLAYPHLKIAIELDGGVHRERDVFERDRPRQNGIVLGGWIVLRFTWKTLVERPEERVVVDPPASLAVVILDPEQDAAAGRACPAPRPDGIRDVAEMEKSGRRRGEPCQAPVTSGRGRRPSTVPLSRTDAGLSPRAHESR
jgi:hypothetical protein